MSYNPLPPLGQTTMAASLPVAIASNQSSLAVTGTFWQTTQPVSLASLPSLATGSNAIGSITNTSFASTQSGTWNVGLSTGSNAIGSITNTTFAATSATATSLKAQAESYQGGTAVSSSNPLYVTMASSASGGDTTFHLVSAATTNATNIKASAGKVTGWYIYNSNASARKVAFHNTAGTPTAGSSVVSAIVIPGLAAANVSFPDGIDFSTGIAITTVTELTDAGNTAVALNDLIINIYYK